jgi:hypothetical protein
LNLQGGGTNQRRRPGVDALGELVPVGEVAPQHLVLAGGGDPRGRLPHERLPVYAPPLRVLRYLLQRRQDRRRCIPATDCAVPLNPRPEPNQSGYRCGGGRTCEEGGTRRPRRESVFASHSPLPTPSPAPAPPSHSSALRSCGAAFLLVEILERDQA